MNKLRENGCAYLTVTSSLVALTRLIRLVVRVLSAAVILLIVGRCFLVVLATHLHREDPGDLILRNLRDIEQKKQMWADEHKQNVADTPSADELAPFFVSGKFPLPLIGETYHINPVSQQPTAMTPPRFNKATLTTEAGFLVTIPDK